MSTPQKDLIGNDLSPDETELLAIYIRLKTLSAREDLAPCALMNVRQAMVMMWNACNDLELLFEEPGVD